MTNDYVNELESRNEELTSDLEKLAKELEEAKAKIYELENPPRASMRIRYTKEAIADLSARIGVDLSKQLEEEVLKDINKENV